MRVTGFAIVFLAILITLGQQTILTRADHADGNMPDQVNYWLVEDQLRVCDTSNIVTGARLDSAIAIWNDGLGATLLVNSCANAGVIIFDVLEGECPEQPALACAALPYADQTLQLEIWMEPDSQGTNDRVVSILASELGHNLGFDHSPCPSIMAPATCTPYALALTTGDQTNYHDGYHAVAVAS